MINRRYARTPTHQVRRTRLVPYRSRTERLPDHPYGLPERTRDVMGITALVLLCCLWEAFWRLSEALASVTP